MMSRKEKETTLPPKYQDCPIVTIVRLSEPPLPIWEAAGVGDVKRVSEVTEADTRRLQ